MLSLTIALALAAATSSRAAVIPKSAIHARGNTDVVVPVVQGVIQGGVAQVCGQLAKEDAAKCTKVTNALVPDLAKTVSDVLALTNDKTAKHDLNGVHIPAVPRALDAIDVTSVVQGIIQGALNPVSGLVNGKTKVCGKVVNEVVPNIAKTVTDIVDAAKTEDAAVQPRQFPGPFPFPPFPFGDSHVLPESIDPVDATKTEDSAVQPRDLSDILKLIPIPFLGSTDLAAATQTTEDPVVQPRQALEDIDIPVMPRHIPGSFNPFPWDNLVHAAQTEKDPIVQPRKFPNPDIDLPGFPKFDKRAAPHDDNEWSKLQAPGPVMVDNDDGDHGVLAPDVVLPDFNEMNAPVVVDKDAGDNDILTRDNDA